jgi:hypothetical protein
MNGRQFLELLARLPARVWFEVVLGLIGFAILAVLGFAVIAGVAAAILLVILVFKAKAWLTALLSGGGRGGPPVRGRGRVIDVQYEIVDRKDRK